MLIWFSTIRIVHCKHDEYMVIICGCNRIPICPVSKSVLTLKVRVRHMLRPSIVEKTIWFMRIIRRFRKYTCQSWYIMCRIDDTKAHAHAV